MQCIDSSCSSTRIFLMSAPLKVHLKFIDIIYTFPHKCFIVYTHTELSTFQCLDGPSLSCRSDPASPHIQFRESEHMFDSSSRLHCLVFHFRSVQGGKLTQPQVIIVSARKRTLTASYFLWFLVFTLFQE